MHTQQIIDKIFKDPTVKYDLTEFEGLGKPIHEMLNIYAHHSISSPVHFSITAGSSVLKRLR